MRKHENLLNVRSKLFCLFYLSCKWIKVIFRCSRRKLFAHFIRNSVEFGHLSLISSRANSLHCFYLNYQNATGHSRKSYLLILETVQLHFMICRFRSNYMLKFCRLYSNNHKNDFKQTRRSAKHIKCKIKIIIWDVHFSWSFRRKTFTPNCFCHLSLSKELIDPHLCFALTWKIISIISVQANKQIKSIKSKITWMICPIGD